MMARDVRVEHERFAVCASTEDEAVSVVVNCRRVPGTAPRWELTTEDPTNGEQIRGTRRYATTDEVIAAATEMADRMLVVKARRADLYGELESLVADFGGSR